ncbi:MAG TPA: hypothetical protein VN934_06085 [Candidatus Tumulicola sp.]|nr:hypothetical protein [Candidatus Tumulicola sp.]
MDALEADVAILGKLREKEVGLFTESKDFDDVERTLSAVLDRILVEMDELGTSRRERIEARQGSVASVSQLVSNYTGTVERMSPKNLRAHKEREALALRKLAPRMDALGLSFELPPVSAIEVDRPEFLAAYPDEVREAITARVQELFTLVDEDRGQFPLLYAFAVDEMLLRVLRSRQLDSPDAEVTVPLKQASARLKKLAESLALNRVAVERHGSWISPEEGLLTTFVENCERAAQAREEEAQEERVRVALDARVRRIINGEPSEERSLPGKSEPAVRLAEEVHKREDGTTTLPSAQAPTFEEALARERSTQALAEQLADQLDKQWTPY